MGNVTKLFKKKEDSTPAVMWVCTVCPDEPNKFIYTIGTDGIHFLECAECGSVSQPWLHVDPN